MTSSDPLSKILVQYVMAGGPAWTPLIGYVLILYGYLCSDTFLLASSYTPGSNGKRNRREWTSLADQISLLWTVLCCYALSGLAAVAIESCVSAVNQYDPAQNWLGMLGFGVFFSMIEEGCAVLYFIVKLEGAFRRRAHRIVLQVFLGLSFVCYAVGRGWETYLKINNNLVAQSSINQVNLPSLQSAVVLFSVSYFLLNSGLLVLLAQASRPSTQKKCLKKTVKSTRFFRLSTVPLTNMIVSITTIACYLSFPKGEALDYGVEDMLQVLSAISCAFPLVFLFDMMYTEDAAITEVINSEATMEEQEKREETYHGARMHTFESYRASSQIPASQYAKESVFSNDEFDYQSDYVVESDKNDSRYQSESIGVSLKTLLLMLIVMHWKDQAMVLCFKLLSKLPSDHLR